MAATVPSAAERIEREVDGTLALVDEIRQRVRRDDLPGWVWLRAARGCWLIGNTDWSTDFYKRAALGLTQYALEVGRRTGTFEGYANVAIGAAWASGQRDVLADCGRQLDGACEQQLISTELPPEPLIRVNLLLTRLRIAWYREQTVLVREYDAELARRAAQLDAWAKSAWQAERGIVSHATIQTFSALRASATSVVRTPPGQLTPVEAARKALRALDQRQYDLRARPPAIGNLVDEEFLSFAAALRAASPAPLPVLRLPTEPGRFSV